MKKEIIKDYDDVSKIVCPNCDEIQGIELSESGLVTYWGEESVKWKCGECRKEFFIRERVSRYWEVAEDWNNF